MILSGEGQDAVRRRKPFRLFGGPPTLMEMKMEMHTRASLLAIHGIDAPVRAPLGLGAWLSRFAQRMQKAARFRRDYETLMAKTDRELSDIGLTRGDVIAAFEYGRWPARRPGR